MELVCGTDFSEAATKAANAGAALASRVGGRLRLVYVLDLSRYDSPSKKLVADLSEARRTRLMREAQRLRKTGAAVDEHLLQGRPEVELASFASKSKADLVVVSSRGHTTPVWWPVGSVAERVAMHATVPTLVVRDETAFKRWTAGKQALRIFVGYEVGREGEAALRWVRGLVDMGPCQITVASLAWPPQKTWRLGVGEHLSGVNGSAEIPVTLLRSVRDKCDELLGPVKARIQVEATCGRPDSQLIGMARSGKAELVVVHRAAEQSWMGTVSRDILYYAPFNVACVPNPVRCARPLRSSSLSMSRSSARFVGDSRP